MRHQGQTQRTTRANLIGLTTSALILNIANSLSCDHLSGLLKSKNERCLRRWISMKSPKHHHQNFGEQDLRSTYDILSIKYACFWSPRSKEALMYCMLNHECCLSSQERVYYDWSGRDLDRQNLGTCSRPELMRCSHNHRSRTALLLAAAHQATLNCQGLLMALYLGSNAPRAS